MFFFYNLLSPFSSPTIYLAPFHFRKLYYIKNKKFLKTHKQLGIYVAPQRSGDDGITNLMDIRSALNEATTTSSGGNSTGGSASQHHHHHHHHHHSFFHHHGSISIHLNSSNSATNQHNTNNNSVANQQQQPQQQQHTQSHLHNFISGPASSALNALMGHHYHHNHGTAAAAAASNNNHNNNNGNNNNVAAPALTLSTALAQNNSSIPVASGSQSAGVLGSISFGLPSASSGQDQQQQHQYQQQTNLPHSPTPPLQRRLAKSFSVAPNLTQQKGALYWPISYFFPPKTNFTQL